MKIVTMPLYPTVRWMVMHRHDGFIIHILSDPFKISIYHLQFVANTALLLLVFILMGYENVHNSSKLLVKSIGIILTVLTISYPLFYPKSFESFLAVIVLDLSDSAYFIMDFLFLNIMYIPILILHLFIVLLVWLIQHT